MTIDTLLAEPWAITREGLEAVLHGLGREGLQAQDLAGVLDGDGLEIDLKVVRGIAVIPVAGALYRWSYGQIRQQVDAALADGGVRAVLLRVNSPGGLVSGCKELADHVAGAGKIKPVYAYADGTMCSAAYWIGSAARQIAAPVTAAVGSIGVRTVHVDWSAWNEKAGLSFTHLAAGAYKTLGNEDEPLDQKARDYFQARLDALYSIFVDAVARQRGTDVNGALAMADGRVFLAQEALAKGLIDLIQPDFESYFSMILKKESMMDLTQFKTDHPDLYGRVLDEGKALGAAEKDQAIKAAVDATVAGERERILGIAGAVLGTAAAERFGKVVVSGASAEVVQSLAQTFATDGGDADTASRQKILEGLEQAHSGGVGLETGKQTAKGTDLEQSAKEYADLANG